MLFLNALLNVENIIKNAIVQQFCSTYGFKEDAYLNKGNYNTTHTYLNKIMGIFKQQIEEKKKNNIAVEYYINTYGYVPFWVISKVLSFGLVKDLYNIMNKTDQRAVKDSICHYKDTKIKHLYTQLQLMVHKRNNTAHDEIFFNDIDRKLLIHKTEEHKKFDLNNNRSGLNDTLGLLICIKNILPRKDFNILIDDLICLIDNYISNNKVITKNELLNEMHLPVNCEELR